MCVWGAVMRDPEWWAAEQLAKHNSSSCASLSMRSEGGKTSLGEGNEKNDFPGVEEIKRYFYRSFIWKNSRSSSHHIL